MLKGFVFLLIIWNSYYFALSTNHLQFLLGCQAVIPCQHYRSDSKAFKWFYKKDELSETMQIFFQDKTGINYHQLLFRDKIKVPHNRSLVIGLFTENDQGLYWCSNCFQDNCQNEQPTVFSVKKEILKEIRQTIYVAAGSSFTHACPGDLTNYKWTFEASNMIVLRNSEERPGPSVPSSKSIHIVNVKRAHAGKYMCWTSGCDGHRQKLLTINLCVITVHHSEDKSVSCAVMCDLEFNNIKPNSTSNVKTRTVSVLLDPYGSLNCSTKQMFEGYNTGGTHTHRPFNAFNTTTGIPTEPEYVIPVIYGTTAAVTCFIVMVLLICYLRPRLRAASPIQLCCCRLKGRVEETSVVYSSVVIRSTAKTTDYPMTYSDIYSETKV